MAGALVWGTAHSVDITPTTTSFNIVRVGVASPSQGVTIVNNSAAAAALQATAATGPFFATAGVLLNGAKETEPEITIDLEGNGVERAGRSATGLGPALWALLAVASASLRCRRR